MSSFIKLVILCYTSHLFSGLLVASPELGIDELGDQFRGFVDSSVDEVLETFLHPVHEFLIPLEAVLDDLVQFFL